MATKEKEKPTATPTMLEADTREEMMKVLNGFKAGNPDIKCSAIQYDEYRAKPYWVDIINNSKS